MNELFDKSQVNFERFDALYERICKRTGRNKIPFKHRIQDTPSRKELVSFEPKSLMEFLDNSMNTIESYLVDLRQFMLVRRRPF